MNEVGASPTIAYDEAMGLYEEAKKDAERLLSIAWSDSKVSFPVDPVRIASRVLGINIIDAYLDDDIAGALVKEPGKDPVILVNQTDSRNRKRFTVAHELGHYVQRTAEPEQYEYVDRRDALSSGGTNADEIYANSFAANLLMPEEEVNRLTSEGVSEFEMALRFGVSPEAMICYNPRVRSGEMVSRVAHNH